jgi:hypothetical protein
VDRIFLKHGYLPPHRIDRLSQVAGGRPRAGLCIQADTCVLAAGFLLFDAGLHPTLLPWLTIGSSLDRSGELGARLWRHHFGAVLSGPDENPRLANSGPHDRDGVKGPHSVREGARP